MLILRYIHLQDNIYTITEKYQPNPRETRCTAIDNGLVEWIKNFNKSFC